MKAIADVCIVPVGSGTSVSEYVAECQRILEAAGLNPKLHAYGTNIEGDFDKVTSAIRECHRKLHSMGVTRVSTNIRIGTRSDREQSCADKVKSVQQKLQ